MTEFKVLVPGESYSLYNFKTDNLPGVACVNVGLKGFSWQEVFSWHLSLNITFNEMIENGMPSHKECEVVDKYFDKVDLDIKGDLIHPNGLFLARITWNGTRELVWRVFDPEIANSYLQNIINRKESPREFEYTIENDPRWEKTAWYLQDFRQSDKK